MLNHKSVQKKKILTHCMRTAPVFIFFGVWMTFWGTVTTATAQDEGVLQHLLAPGEFNAFHKSISGIKNCSKCHSIGKGISSSKCLDCHKLIRSRLSEKKGLHGTFQGECVECHKEHSKNLIVFTHENFDHRQALFPLEGSHKNTPCEKCHLKKESQTGSQRFTYIGGPTSCKGCHKSPHENDFSECSLCHSTDKWRLLFDHNKNGVFRLEGMHQPVHCEKCHPGFQNKDRNNIPLSLDTSRQCLSCHKDKHLGKMSHVCLNCHNMKGWKQTSFDHNKTKFPLTGPHQKLSCNACHVDPKITGLPVDCGGCHKKSPHNDTHTPCNACHSQDDWQKLRTDWKNQRDIHKFFRYPLQGAHTKLECQKCHAPDDNKPVYFNMEFTDCLDCHKDKHQKQLSAPCSRCHTVDSFKNLALFDHEKANFTLGELHKKVTCKECHPKNLYKNSPSSCFRCHLDIARFSRGFFKQTRMDLISPKAKIVGCTGCHETSEANYKVTEKTCAKCHEAAYQQFFLQWRQQFSEQIKALENELVILKQCKTNPRATVLTESEDMIQFLKINFEHNYRFAAALTQNLLQDLIDIRQEFCKDESLHD